MSERLGHGPTTKQPNWWVAEDAARAAIASWGDAQTGWVPQAQADLPAFEKELDVVLQKTLDGVRGEILSLVRAKGVVYQNAEGVDSCFRRGLPGLYHNVMRKVDRIETVARRLGFEGQSPEIDAALRTEAQMDGEDPETLYKTVRDMAVYCVHMMRWMRGEREHGHDFA